MSGAPIPPLTLVRGADVYAPEPLGTRDILLGGGRILGVADRLEPPRGLEVETLAADGLVAIPGLVDLHVHFAGAGGEGGPATRTPELPASALLAGGTTTAVGCLGADGVTRTISALLMKAKGLREEGVSAWIYTSVRSWGFRGPTHCRQAAWSRSSRGFTSAAGEGSGSRTTCSSPRPAPMS